MSSSSATPLLHSDIPKTSSGGMSPIPSRLARTAVTILGTGRVAVGLGCILLPQTVASLSGLPFGDSALTWRMVGVRDVILGGLALLASRAAVTAGAATAEAKKAEARHTIWAGAVADTADVVVCAVAVAAGEMSWGGFGAMAGGVVVFVGLAAEAARGFR